MQNSKNLPDKAARQRGDTRQGTILSRNADGTYQYESLRTKEVGTARSNVGADLLPGMRVVIGPLAASRETIGAGDVILMLSPREQRGVALVPSGAISRYMRAIVTGLSPNPVRLGAGDPAPQELRLRGFHLSAAPTYELAEVTDDTPPVITSTLITCSLVAAADAPLGLSNLTCHGVEFEDAIEVYEVPPVAWVAVESGAATPTAAFMSAINPPTEWASRDAPSSGAWQNIAYGDGTWVTVASTGTNRVATSQDGKTWTAHSAAEANSWRSVATDGNGTWVAVSVNGTNRIMRSIDDGVTWSAIAAPLAVSWIAVTWGGSQFVAVANASNRAMTSPDGVTWTLQTMSATSGWDAITYSGSLYVAVAAASGTARVATSPDGVTWTTRTPAESNDWEGVTSDGAGVVVAVATSGTNRVMRSTDHGVTWAAIAAPEANAWNAIAYGNSEYVAVATSGTNRVMRSTDGGVTWSAIAAAAAKLWTGVAFAG